MTAKWLSLGSEIRCGFFSLLLIDISSMSMLSKNKWNGQLGGEIRLFKREAEQTIPGELDLDFDQAHILTVWKNDIHLLPLVEIKRTLKAFDGCFYSLKLKIDSVGLAGVVQLVEALSHKPKGSGLVSWSGHITRLWVHSPVRVCIRGNQPMFLSHINVSLPLSLPPTPSL